jgi:hypothetical protein
VSTTDLVGRMLTCTRINHWITSPGGQDKVRWQQARAAAAALALVLVGPRRGVAVWRRPELPPSAGRAS